MFFLHLLLSVLLPVGYSHVGDGILPCSPEFREITFLLPVSFYLEMMPSQALLLRPRRVRRCLE